MCGNKTTSSGANFINEKDIEKGDIISSEGTGDFPTIIYQPVADQR